MLQIERISTTTLSSSLTSRKQMLFVYLNGSDLFSFSHLFVANVYIHVVNFIHFVSLKYRI